MNRIKIIAEAGVNHNGKIKNAIKLVNIAKLAGADYVKFQIYKTENLLLKNTSTAEYQKKNTKFNNQFQMLKKYELSYDEHLQIYQYCKKIKIKYLASVFDEESLLFLKSFQNIVKIGSGEITNLSLLSKISELRMEVILSTGASNFYDICTAVNNLKRNKLIILHCHSSYPSENFRNLNLNCISKYKKKFNVEVGFSDHTKKFYASIIALGLGSTIFEKHLTINKKLTGPDHMSSLDPKEFNKYVKILNLCNEALGDGVKKITLEEKKNILLIRKSLYAKQPIKKGERFSKSNLIPLRPNKGISANKFFQILGKKSKKTYKKFDLIER
jgi:N,N'-diacetyllegionaminate synthase